MQNNVVTQPLFSVALRVLHMHYHIKPHNIPVRQGHFASDYGLLC